MSPRQSGAHRQIVRCVHLGRVRVALDFDQFLFRLYSGKDFPLAPVFFFCLPLINPPDRFPVFRVYQKSRTKKKDGNNTNRVTYQTRQDSNRGCFVRLIVGPSAEFRYNTLKLTYKEKKRTTSEGGIDQWPPLTNSVTENCPDPRLQWLYSRSCLI